MKEDSTEVKRIASDILSFLRDRSSQQVTYAELARAVGAGDHTKTKFRLALRRARQEAEGHGEWITDRQWCYELGAYTVTYLPAPAPGAGSESELLTDLSVRLRRFSRDASELHGAVRTIPPERETASLLTQAIAGLAQAVSTAVVAADLASRESERARDTPQAAVHHAQFRAALSEGGPEMVAP